MTSLVVTGYASLDYPVALAGQIKGDQTTLINHRDPGAWPRMGGCPAYVSSAVAAGGGDAFPISWIGDDPNGQMYVKGMANAGAHRDGIHQLTDRRSPAAILAYQADGACACLFDPAFAGEEALSDTQRELIRSADHLCVSVGPPHLMVEILSCRPQETRLYWVLKNDGHCFTPAICKQLSASADVIFCSHSERDLIAEITENTVIVETRGSDGISISHNDLVETLHVDPIAVRDTTGAGDTLAGGFMAANMTGTTDPLEAARQAITCVRQMLVQRLKGGGDA